MKEKETFDPSFFSILRKAEEGHFWFSVRRSWIYDKIKKIAPPPADMLEIGCGTGNVASFLAGKGYSLTGCEFHEEAIAMAWPGFSIFHGDARALPFGSERFDVAGLFDVVEHFDDDAALIKEAVRVVKKDGIVAVTVPAGEELWSYFDEYSSHKRRYSPEMLKSLFAAAGLDILVLEYAFMSLYAPLKWSRKSRREKKDIFKIHPFMNLLLKGIFTGERLVSRIMPPPVGTSLICIGRKKQGILSEAG